MRISIDGPSGSGKTTLGRRLSDTFDVPFLDTGVTFRAIASLLLRDRHPPGQGEVAQILRSVGHLPYRAGQAEAVVVDGRDIIGNVWDERVDDVLPWLTESDSARDEILRFHMSIVGDDPFVVAGRDVATTLLRDAALKVFLDAAFDTRRERRRRQAEVEDFRPAIVGPGSIQDDQSRGAVSNDPVGLILDTTDLTADEVFRVVLVRVTT
jgi:cytidylate kinase